MIRYLFLLFYLLLIFIHFFSAAQLVKLDISCRKSSKHVSFKSRCRCDSKKQINLQHYFDAFEVTNSFIIVTILQLLFESGSFKKSQARYIYILYIMFMTTFHTRTIQFYNKLAQSGRDLSQTTTRHHFINYFKRNEYRTTQCIINDILSKTVFRARRLTLLSISHVLRDYCACKQ